MLGCSQQTEQHTPIRIAVAASSADVLKEISTVYEKKHQTKIEVISGSSGKLAAQLEQNAPFDIYLAADATFIQSLFKKKVIDKQGQPFTTNQLAVWSSSPIVSLKTTLEKATKISIANPQTAPFGLAALTIFDELGISPTQLIYGNSIAQVNQYIANNTVDVAFTSSSSRVQLLNEGFEAGYWQLLNQQLTQHIVQINESQLTSNFYQFLFTEEANQIFKTYGFNL